MLKEIESTELCPDAKTLTRTIHRLASRIMSARYGELSVGMKLLLGNIIKNTRVMLEDDSVNRKT